MFFSVGKFTFCSKTIWKNLIYSITFALHAFFISNAFYQVNLTVTYLLHELSLKCCLVVA